MTKIELLKQGKEYYRKSLWCQATMPEKEYLKKLVKEWEEENRSK